MAQLVSVHLSGRAECAHDVAKIFARMLQDKGIMQFVNGYSCRCDSVPFPDARFDIAFVATESKKADMHTAIKELVKIIERQPDAHRCLETIAFTDEFLEDKEDGSHVERVLQRLDAKTVPFTASIFPGGD